ncbi:MAG: hypothetical protein LIO91_03530 [Bacteroidales bacterium]|nr:hypothetical protein [Bacteroidales bacterium]
MTTNDINHEEMLAAMQSAVEFMRTFGRGRDPKTVPMVDKSRYAQRDDGNPWCENVIAITRYRREDTARNLNANSEEIRYRREVRHASIKELKEFYHCSDTTMRTFINNGYHLEPGYYKELCK